jgi:glycerol uptake facilitator-like aquaporin
MTIKIKKRFIAEGAGTALLLAAIVGSGIMAERLAQGNNALALLANSLATGGALAALIAGPVRKCAMAVHTMPTSAMIWYFEMRASPR